MAEEGAREPEVAVQALGLTMHFGRVKALENVSFRVFRGEILGLLGRNGAGKTTTMRILTTYLSPTAGTATVAGFDVVRQPLEVRRRIGYLPESVPVYPEMEAAEYLRFVGRGRGLSGRQLRQRLEWVAESCRIASVLRRPIGELSKGFRQRVTMAQALIHDPEILIFDEPTSGLDPIQILSVRDLVRGLAKEKTIIFSTHILQEVEAMSRRIVIIDEGRVVAEGTKEELFRRVGVTSRVRIEMQPDGAAPGEILTRLSQVEGVRSPREAGPMRFEVEAASEAVPRILAALSAAGGRVRDVSVREPRLEDAFVRLVKSEEKA